MIDLDAYFRRIGYVGSPRPDLATLGDLQRRHVAAIPFEGFDPLLGRTPSLELDDLQAKLVASRRGGYCFEQNTLFRAALEAIGFSVTGLGARVVANTQPGDPLPPRGHMVLQVELPEGPHLADVGFGLLLQDAPLKLALGEQSTPRADYRLRLRDDGLYALDFRQDDGWRGAFVFSLEPQLPSDYRMANHYFATHAAGSPFPQMIVLQRLTPEARVSLVNLRLSERRRDGQLSERMLSSPAELAETLDRVFDLEPPATAEELFARVAA
jgi:N-hydroxyarylamine O-acetyltransferase